MASPQTTPAFALTGVNTAGDTNTITDYHSRNSGERWLQSIFPMYLFEIHTLAQIRDSDLPGNVHWM